MRYGRRYEGEDARVRTQRVVWGYWQAHPLKKTDIEELVTSGVHVLIDYQSGLERTATLPIIWWNDPDMAPLSSSTDEGLGATCLDGLPRHFYLLRQIILIVARKRFDPDQRGLIEPGLKAACFQYAARLWWLGELPMDERTLSHLLRREARLLPEEGHNNLSLS